mmetsp:Transcript_4499/g.13214  ORF Transcript_4499/g.13214 Transcript_4499/m.13214 type:complete len:298 (+) Transcript_4499:628-1521(+)
MSLYSPGLRTETPPLKPGPRCICSACETQPRSPHMPPPFCAVGHSECSLQSFANLSDLSASSSGFLACRRRSSSSSSRSSLMMRRSRDSASERVRIALKPGTTGCLGPSWYLTRICLSRVLLVSSVGLALSPDLAFFFGGPSDFSPAVLPVAPPCCSSSPVPSPLGPPASSQTSTAVHCAPGSLSSAAVVISPQAARGCAGKHMAVSTSCLVSNASITGFVASSRQRCLSAHPSLNDWISGMQLRTGPAFSPTCFQSGSPSDLLTGDMPAGPQTRASRPSPMTVPPPRRSRPRSSAM